MPRDWPEHYEPTRDDLATALANKPEYSIRDCLGCDQAMVPHTMVVNPFGYRHTTCDECGHLVVLPPRK